MQKIAASEFLRLRLLLVLCEIELSFWLKNILIDIHVIECIFVCWAWKKYGIFEGNRTFFWYKSIEDFISYVIILCVLAYFIFLRWIAWYLIAFLFICLLVANVKIAQNIAWNWFERLSFVALLTQVFIIFFFYYLFILHSFYFLCDFYIFKILQELFIIVWYLFKMIILVTDWFLLHKLILQLIVL